MIRKKTSDQETLRIWQSEYCREHLLKGHSHHCYAWLDNGVCPQKMVSGDCCYEHSYPEAWSEHMVKQHKLIEKYVEDLYQGCDILDLVGKGKKGKLSVSVPSSKSLACLFSDVVDKKVNTQEEELIKKSSSISDFRPSLPQRTLLAQTKHQRHNVPTADDTVFDAHRVLSYSVDSQEIGSI